ncbi:MAG: hypothetical protein V1798_06120, partial [Pseudomonadota bacterium]
MQTADIFSKKKTWLSLAVFLTAVVSVWPTIASVFLFDDFRLVAEHPAFAHPVPFIPFLSHEILEGLKAESLFRPIFMLTVFFQGMAFHHDPILSHGLNVALHATVAVLLFHLVASFWGVSFRTFLASMIFAAHPIHVDAVAFVKNRSELLAALFLLLAAIFLVQNVRWKELFSWKRLRFDCVAGGWGTTVAASTLFFCALGSKESAVAGVEILAVFLALRWFRGAPIARSSIWKLTFPLGAALAFYLLARIEVLGTIALSKDAFFPSGVPLWQRLLIFSRISYEYLSLLFFPLGLRVDYLHLRPEVWINDSLTFLSVAVHVLLLGIAAFAFRRARLFSFLILGFYVSLLPVSHIMPFGDVMAERFLYVPSVFFCVAVAWAVEKLRGPARGWVLRWVVAGSLVVGYGAGSFRYSQAFASAPSLWSEMVAR